MLVSNRGLRKIGVAVLGYLPCLVFASAPVVVVGPFTPPPAPPVTGGAGAAGPVEAVPLLGTELLVALALLLAVIAFRFLRHNPSAQKILCLGLLGSATLLTAWGVGKTTAGVAIVPVPVDDPVCNGDVEERWLTISNVYSVPIENRCESTSLEILRYQNMSCPEENWSSSDGASVGDVIAPGETVQAKFCPGLG